MKTLLLEFQTNVRKNLEDKKVLSLTLNHKDFQKQKVLNLQLKR